jgi:hypothetical protein
MRRKHGNRARLGGVLVAVAAALALLATSGVAAAEHGGNDPAAPAGTIQSFDPETGVLVIDLAGGGSVSGLVGPRTHIHCDNGKHHGRHGLRHHLRSQGATASHGGGAEGEDHRGRGEEEAGDDHGGRGVEPGEDDHENGDDPPGHDGTAPGRSEGPGQGADHPDRCTTDDLLAGTTVKAAELVLIDGKAIYREVDLPKPV